MRYIFKELRRHSWRTAFSVAGYAVATVFLLLILSVSGKNRKDSFTILHSTGTHFIVYIPTDSSCCSNCYGSGTTVAEGVKTMLLDSQLIKTIKNVKGVRDAAPCLLYRMYSESFKADITISGIDTNSVATRTNSCARANLIAGKFLSGNPGELVAEQSFATAHKLKLGDTLDIFGGKITVAGIVNSGIKPVKADFYAPIGSVRTILRDKLQCSAPYLDMNIILVEVADARLQDDVMEHIRKMMYKFAVSSYNCYEPAYRVMEIIDRSSLLMAILVFLFLVLFSAKTQLTALTERFREIGILKSLGWSDVELSNSILAGSIIQAVAGVSIGILAGVVMLHVFRLADFSIFSRSGSSLGFRDLLLVYSLSLIGSVIASLFPIVKLCRSRAGDIMKNYL
jgi:putative ABC transport system permease protein